MRFSYYAVASLGNSILRTVLSCHNGASTVRTVWFGSTILLLLLQPVSAFGTATGMVFAVDHGDGMEEEVKDNAQPTCGGGGALCWDNINNSNNNNEWWNRYSSYDTTSHSWDNNINNNIGDASTRTSSSTAALQGDNDDWSLILWLLWSALHRLLNEMVHAWLVPLYTLSVIGYWMTLHIQQFWKRRRQRKQQQQQQQQQEKQQAPSTALVSVSPVEMQPPTLNQRNLSHDMDNTNDDDHTHSMINLSGLYQLIRIENLDAFLAAQGVPWPLRKAASKVMPRHEITHTTHNHQLTIRIDAGPIQTRTTYQIGAGSVETEIRGRVFRDNVNYLKDRVTGKVVGVVNEKTAVTEGYQITVSRRLSDDRKHIFMESVAYFPKDPTKEPIVSTQLFERVEQ